MNSPNNAASEEMTPGQRLYEARLHSVEIVRPAKSWRELSLPMKTEWEGIAQAALTASLTNDAAQPSSAAQVDMTGKLLHTAINETRTIQALLEIQWKLQRALQECRDALEEAANFHDPRFDHTKMRDVRVEAVVALASIQVTGNRWDDKSPLPIPSFTSAALAATDKGEG